MRTKILEVLNTLRPSLEAHGGDVELVEVDEAQKTVKVKLIGACQHCPMAEETLRMGVEKALREEIPEIKEVVTV